MSDNEISNNNGSTTNKALVEGNNGQEEEKTENDNKSSIPVNKITTTATDEGNGDVNLNLPEENKECQSQDLKDSDNNKSSQESESEILQKVPKVEEEIVELRVIFNKKPMPIRISLDKTVGDLKQVIEGQTKVAAALQKVLVKGIGKDEMTLKSLGLTNGSKVLVIGTSIDDVMAMSKPPSQETFSSKEQTKADNSDWCTLPQHRKIIDKGVPDDCMPGILGDNEQLPSFPLSGMVGNRGGKVRLNFKLEHDELWILFAERTEKIKMGSIRSVISQPILGYEHYHILALQIGPTEASRFYIYWVPCQYIKAIKEILS